MTTSLDVALPDLPTARRGRDVAILAAVFVCAACGLVYELALVALGSYLLGNSITQASLVISFSLFAMGAGALIAKPLARWPAVSFITVELSLAIVGGLSIPALYASFAWLSIYTPAMLVCAIVIGALIGAEIPLLMELLQRIRPRDATTAVANITAVDYAGALVGGLAFPFLLLPVFGLLQGTLVVAAVNVAAALFVGVFAFGGLLSRSGRIGVTLGCLVVSAALLAMSLVAEQFEMTARQSLYADPIIHAERSGYQEIVLTQGALTGRGVDDLRLFLDGDLQFSSADEYRYHEALVHPAMAGSHEQVLILGGGDGLALREVLRYDTVAAVTVVELDPAVVDLARTHSDLVALNSDAFADARVEHVAADAFGWVRSAPRDYDVVIIDLPDPDNPTLGKLYSVEMYSMVSSLLATDGRMVVQAGSTFFTREGFWCVETTVAAAGLATLPYHVSVPSFGEWGFVLAGAEQPELTMSAESPAELRFLTSDVLSAASVFPLDRGRIPVEVSTLLDPVIVEYVREGWLEY